MDAPLRAAPEVSTAYPDADPLTLECVINVLRTESLLTADLNTRFRKYGLTTATFNVLIVLRWSEVALCPADIGDRLLVTRGTVTGLLDTLEKRGLIRRQAHPSDRRMLQIELTDAGRSLLDELLPEHYRTLKARLAGLTPGEKSRLVELLGKVQRLLAPQEPAPGAAGDAPHPRHPSR